MSNLPGRKTILCIDDDSSMLGYQRELLERRGFKVLTAASARQGLQIAVACAVAAVIVDYHMPDMNGHETRDGNQAPPPAHSHRDGFQ